MIARTWRGATRASAADAYVAYLKRTGFAEYGSTPGNVGVVGLRRLCGDRAEFLLVSLWDTKEAVTRFAGADVNRAVFYPEDDAYLVDRDEHVLHYEVVHHRWSGNAAESPRNVPLRLPDRVRAWWLRHRPAAGRDAAPRITARGWGLIGLR